MQKMDPTYQPGLNSQLQNVVLILPFEKHVQMSPALRCLNAG